MKNACPSLPNESDSSAAAAALSRRGSALKRVASVCAAAALTVAGVTGVAGVAGADTLRDPAGSSSPGSSAALSSGHYGLGEFNKSVTSSWNLLDQPAPTGGARVVVFGDSQTGATALPLYTDSRGCMHSRASWPNQLAGMIGEGEVVDASCWGSGLNSGHGIPFADQVRYAESLGAIGPRTEKIIVQLGFNDAWSGGDVTMLEMSLTCVFNRAACNRGAVGRAQVLNPDDITTTSYIARMKPVTDYLRYYAKNASIDVLGYPALYAPGSRTMCASVAGMPLPLPGSEMMGEAIEKLRDVQRESAHKLGFGFIDLTEITGGHHSCSADPWVNGIMDRRADHSGAVFHPTTRGNHVTALVIRDRLG